MQQQRKKYDIEFPKWFTKKNDFSTFVKSNKDKKKKRDKKSEINHKIIFDVGSSAAIAKAANFYHNRHFHGELTQALIASHVLIHSIGSGGSHFERARSPNQRKRRDITISLFYWNVNSVVLCCFNTRNEEQEKITWHLYRRFAAHTRHTHRHTFTKMIYLNPIQNRTNSSSRFYSPSHLVSVQVSTITNSCTHTEKQAIYLM